MAEKEEIKFDDDYASLFNDVNTGNVEEVVKEPVVEQNVKPEPVLEQNEPEVVKEPVVENTTPNPVVEEVVAEPAIEQNATPEPQKKLITEEDLDAYYEARDKKKAEEDKRLAEEKRLQEEAEEKAKLEEEKTIFSDYNFDTSKVTTAEDTKFLKEFNEEFPEVMKVLDIKIKEMKAEYDDKVRFLERSTRKDLTSSYINMYDKINKDFLPYVKRSQEQEYNTAVEQFKRDLSSKHNDWETLVPEVGVWIKEQEEEVQIALNTMIGSGVVEKVSKVYDRFKKEKGLNSNTNQSQVNAEKEKAEKERLEKEKHKVLSRQEALMGTSSKTTVPTNNTSDTSGNEDEYVRLWNSVKTS